MGGFVTGMVGEVGKRIQAHHERQVEYQHQAQEEQAQQYDKMAEDAAKAGNDELAADLHKASFGIRTTLPGAKPKKITNPDGTTMDPLDMQGIIAKHTRLAAERMAKQPAPSQPLAPNGVAPQMGGAGSGASALPAQLTPPPGGAPQGAGNDPLGILGQ